jgi:hypothetical protein
MTDKISEANFARDQEKSFTGTTAIGMHALKPIMSLQVSMLRMWADNIERFAGNYERERCGGTVGQGTRRLESNA